MRFRSNKRLNNRFPCHPEEWAELVSSRWLITALPGNKLLLLATNELLNNRLYYNYA